MQQQPTLIWNTVRSVWEIPNTHNLLCEHLAVFSETWQTLGMMQNGQVYQLQMQGHPTKDLEYSSLPTPRAQEPGSTSAGYGDSLNDFTSRVINGYAPKDLLRTPVASEVDGGATAPEVAKAKGQTLRLSGQMIDMVAPDQLPKMPTLGTPNTMDSLPPRYGEAYEKVKNAGGRKNRQSSGNLREQVVHLLPKENKQPNLPTPTTRDHKDGTKEHSRDGKVQTDTVARAVFNSSEITNTNWGKFEPAIRRWENTINRPAPAPTTADGKDGAHRLSSKFTEWMMGLPEGWITGVGLSRNDELKACGNGVVPQQAELALRMLLDGITVSSTGGGQVNLPTPTVSDTFTGSLKSSQQKDGSMHSVTLPQAVRMVTDV